MKHTAAARFCWGGGGGGGRGRRPLPVAARASSASSISGWARFSTEIESLFIFVWFGTLKKAIIKRVEGRRGHRRMKAHNVVDNDTKGSRGIHWSRRPDLFSKVKQKSYFIIDIRKISTKGLPGTAERSGHWTGGIFNGHILETAPRLPRPNFQQKI